MIDATSSCFYFGSHGNDDFRLAYLKLSSAAEGLPPFFVDSAFSQAVMSTQCGVCRGVQRWTCFLFIREPVQIYESGKQTF
jgi:hypothetical protein